MKINSNLKKLSLSIFACTISRSCHPGCEGAGRLIIPVTVGGMVTVSLCTAFGKSAARQKKMQAPP